jgi:hypothetical protein
MSRQERITRAANPSDPRNWDGRSNKEAIARWSERAHQDSDGARHRASTRKEPELPSTGEMNVHSTHRAGHMQGDPYAMARGDLNHDNKLTEYLKGIRRES